MRQVARNGNPGRRAGSIGGAAVLGLAALWLCLGTGRTDAASLEECTTSIRGITHKFFYDPDVQALKDSRSWRERNFGDWGDVTCPGLVTLRAMTPELDDTGRAPFCLQWDKKEDTYIGYAEGERDAWLGCRKPSNSFCQRVNSSKRAASAFAGQSLQAAQSGLATGLAVAQHPSGAVLLNGSGAVVAQQLSTLGATVTAGAAAPVALAGAAVTAVAVGGAVYVCGDGGAEAAAVEAAPDAQLSDGAEVTGTPAKDGTRTDGTGAELLGSELPKGEVPKADAKPEELPAEN